MPRFPVPESLQLRLGNHEITRGLTHKLPPCHHTALARLRRINLPHHLVIIRLHLVTIRLLIALHLGTTLRQTAHTHVVPHRQITSAAHLLHLPPP